MFTSLFGRIASLALLGTLPGACVAAGSPFHHGVAEASRFVTPDTEQVDCPVLLTNETDAVIEAGYVRMGVESVVGWIPVGESQEVTVSCREGRIEAFALSGGGVFDDHVRYRKLARLHASRVTLVEITAADRVR